MKLKDLILKSRNSNKTFIITANDIYTYKQIIEKSISYAQILKKNHKKRINIGLILPNSVEYIEWLFAIILSDNVAVPIFHQSSLSEIKNVIRACDISLFVASFEKQEMFSEITSECHSSYINCFNNKDIKIKNIYKKSNTPNNIILMISTSGSSNSPKRVMLSNDNIVSNSQAIASSLHYEQNEIFGVFLPLCFASANTSQLFTALELGSSLAIYDDLKIARKIVDFISDKKITTITLVPSLFKILIESKEFHPQNMPSLKTICFGGGPSCSTTINDALERFKDINLTHMYGQTEASTRISHMCSKYMIWKDGSVGKPLDGIKVKLVYTKNKEKEICISGPNVTCGYYNQKRLSNSTIKNGWLHTGDIGEIDSDGYIYITGRKRNLIIYCGLNIYPEEIEDVINQISIVEAVIVYGENNEIFGELICADIVLNSNINNWENIIIQHCEKSLPRYKIPRKLNKVSHIERTDNGKIKRHKNA